MLDFRQALESGNYEIIRAAKKEREKRLSIKRKALETIKRADFSKAIAADLEAIAAIQKRIQQARLLSERREIAVSQTAKGCEKLEREINSLKAKLPASKGSVEEMLQCVDKADVSPEKLKAWIELLMKGRDEKHNK